MRNPEWRQKNPKDQLVTVVGAAQGYIDNIKAGIYVNPAPVLDKVFDLLSQAQELTKMVHGEWPEEK